MGGCTGAPAVRCVPQAPTRDPGSRWSEPEEADRGSPAGAHAGLPPPYPAPGAAHAGPGRRGRARRVGGGQPGRPGLPVLPARPHGGGRAPVGRAHRRGLLSYTWVTWVEALLGSVLGAAIA